MQFFFKYLIYDRWPVFLELLEIRYLIIQIQQLIPIIQYLKKKNPSFIKSDLFLFLLC
jgi:hypothetical protein